ncbi:putative recombination initiation defects 3 isoform X3 [Manihot esculenta]|uniref:putative recombination initiation defects 3 isoform X3 n=1 Tax=Manihot esculenta TaxID=3983 RepID=UPI001CC6BB71|nr:putative recombination initiation defects 3 isoform X3 [Manihot esculenta]
MKLKINKACDLNSISVLPPHSRRLSAIPSGLQTSQLRSQPSQQSLSQGISSQHGVFSQLSQTSFDEALANDQRFSSQERENSVKKTSFLPPVSNACEESQMPISRSTSTLMRKWNPVSIPHHKLEGIRQKLIVLDNSLQLMIKGQEETKFSLDGNLKSISDRLSKDIYQDKSQQIFSVLSALKKQMEASLLKLQNDLCMTFTKVMQATACSLKIPSQGSPSITVLPPKVTGCYTIPQRKQEPLRNPAMPPKACGQAIVCPKIEVGAWNTVRPEKATQRAYHKEEKCKGVSSFQKEKQCSVIIESDEEIDGGFSCLIAEKETGIGKYMIEATEESERILRRARRRKRKYCNTIIIN